MCLQRPRGLRARTGVGRDIPADTERNAGILNRLTLKFGEPTFGARWPGDGAHCYGRLRAAPDCEMEVDAEAPAREGNIRRAFPEPGLELEPAPVAEDPT